MTCYLSLHLLRLYPDVSLDSYVPVSAAAARLPGTTAGLCAGDRLNLRDLLHGLMLPSGNDAAMCIAEFFGRFLAQDAGGDPTSQPDRYFIREMNSLASALQLKHTFYRNPHGLSKHKNTSTAEDVNKLAAAAMRMSLFRAIVNTEEYAALVKGGDGYARVVTWENTNKLLRCGFEGVKTGHTGAAGPCLCACVKSGGTRVIVTVLGSVDMQERWIEVPRLAHWGIHHAIKFL